MINHRDGERDDSAKVKCDSKEPWVGCVDLLVALVFEVPIKRERRILRDEHQHEVDGDERKSRWYSNVVNVLNVAKVIR